MSGRVIAVVGPSGVGKDTVMRGLVAARPALSIVRRVITRPQVTDDEDFQTVTEAEFHRQRDAGAFVLDWEAHGFCYGIPIEVQQAARDGAEQLVNLSRGVLADAARAFERLTVLSLTAPEAVLAARLQQRKRESAPERAARLARDVALPPGLDVVSVQTEQPVATIVTQVLNQLYPESV